MKHFTFILILALPLVAQGKPASDRDHSAPDQEQTLVRVEDPWSMTFLTTLFWGVRYRVGYRFGDQGNHEVMSAFNQAAMDWPRTCCKEALSVGYRGYLFSSRFTPYGGTSLYLVTDDVFEEEPEGEKSLTLLPSISIGLHWQAYNGFTLATGFEFFLTHFHNLGCRAESNIGTTAYCRQDPWADWHPAFNLFEIGRSF